LSHPSEGPERLPPLAEAEMTPVQRASVALLLQGPRKALQGPFAVMVRSPGLMDCVQKVGEYIRFESLLADDLRELAILTSSRHWRQVVEWALHAPIALDAGVDREALVALAEGRPPTLGGVQAIVHGFCEELHRTQGVSDETYAAAHAALGEAAVVELAGLCGYYATLAMVMNVARTPPPGDLPPFAVP
jgi:4-carboxymuconolactone decarboxylase